MCLPAVCELKLIMKRYNQIGKVFSYPMVFFLCHIALLASVMERLLVVNSKHVTNEALSAIETEQFPNKEVLTEYKAKFGDVEL